VTSSSPLAERTDVRFLPRVFSFPVMLAGLLVVLAVFTVRSRFDDPDMWWHLKAGEIIWTTHTIPTTDLFPTRPTIMLMSHTNSLPSFLSTGHIGLLAILV
jgi:hypothetical protein